MKHQTQHHSLRHFILLVTLLYLLPVLAVLGGVVPFSLRSAMLLLMFAFALMYSHRHGHTAGELGLRTSNLPKAIGVNILAGIAGAGLVILLPIPGMPEQSLKTPAVAFFFFYILISSPVQEFLFRSFLFAEMQRCGIGSPLLQVMISAVLFAFLHAVYLDPLTGLLSFAAGIMWSIIYQRIPNLAGVSLSHAIIGIMAIMSGIARKI
ncbi:CPBP family intramembrane glutamic endopeptidase [Pelodictyon luteolum]|uniref:Abortive infection protein-like protein n=1 Tax=Chlorobium luteolum (strain DSM 273 / BCRC 81028 / 2530) TaxID=319225 RepID=Q3B4U9_CHLL3|nr:CPBP family intramembrane glutamic endopeptidase [Pelodictyon luteolum]ABB23632.1 abortive infection protein-like protein [Pelodictyon luteolum DSM 273]